MLAAASSLGAQEHRFGPLPVAEVWLGSGSGFLSLPVEAPANARSPSGRWQVTASLGLSSFWLRSPSVSEVIEGRRYRGAVTPEELDGISPWPGFEGIYFADMEVHRLTLDARRRFGRRLELGLRTSIVNADGGFVDPLIEGFHDFFGFRQSGRPQTLENGYALYFRRDGPGGFGEQLRFVRFEQAGLGLGETIVSLKSGLGPGSGPWRQAVLVQLKLPTADDDNFHGSGSVDGAIQYLVSRPWRRWTLYGNAGFTRLGSHDLLTLRPQNIVTVAIAGERPIGPRIHDGRPAPPPAEPVPPVEPLDPRRHGDPDRHRLDPQPLFPDASGNRAAYFSLTNNTAKYGSAVDVSLHAGLRWRR